MYGGTYWPYGTIRPLLVGLALAGETALWLALSRFGSRPGLFFVLFFPNSCLIPPGWQLRMAYRVQDNGLLC